jgi:IS5 family transposase
LEMMDKIIPWNEWISVIKPYYPDGKRGRLTRGIETMLRATHVYSFYFIIV